MLISRGLGSQANQGGHARWFGKAVPRGMPRSGIGSGMSCDKPEYPEIAYTLRTTLGTFRLHAKIVDLWECACACILCLDPLANARAITLFP
jgi:hypothetical protein